LRKTTLAALGSTILLALVVSAIFAIPAAAQGNNNPNKLWGAQTYLLNILGKKFDWNGDPSYESTDRRTMFVPEDVNAFVELHPEYKDSEGNPDLRIWVYQGSDFAVTDPNMFDDGKCNLTIGPGKYEVYFVALGKPGNEAKLEGWIYNVTANEYLLKIGDVTVKHSKRPDWTSGHDMFYVSQAEAAGILNALGVAWPWPGQTEVWVFDFINWLATQTGYEYAYLWKLVSGCKHIQVRFYKIG